MIRRDIYNDELKLDDLEAQSTLLDANQSSSAPTLIVSSKNEIKSVWNTQYCLLCSAALVFLILIIVLSVYF
jgi:hypothetical protein